MEAEQVVEEGVRWAYSCHSMLYINTGIERISEVLSVNQERGLAINSSCWTYNLSVSQWTSQIDGLCCVGV